MRWTFRYNIKDVTYYEKSWKRYEKTIIHESL